MLSRERREAPMIFSAALTVCWRVLWQDVVWVQYHTGGRLVRTFSMVPLQKVHMMGAGAAAFLSFQRK